jgi:ectoine hydroxylase-related dioxygenase (phytanoyl-CoA dioxygenase family)
MATIGTAAQTGGAAPPGAPGETEAPTRQLDEHGYALLRDVLPPEKVAHYRRRILELSAAEPEHGRTQQHVRWLMNKGADFREILLHPRVDPLFRHLLGDGYVLSTLTSNVVKPGAEDQRCHTDFQAGVPEPFPEGLCLTANSLWLLDDFTPENGGTRLVPGSHRRRRNPPPDYTSEPGEVRLAAPAGSVLVLNGALWHSSGANRTDRERVCLIWFNVRSFLKPQFDVVNYLCDEAYAEAQANPDLLRLYGFTTAPRPPDLPPDATPVRRI